MKKIILSVLLGALSMTANVFAESQDNGNNGKTDPTNPDPKPGSRPNSESGTTVHYYVVENELFLYTVDSAMAQINIYDAVTGILLYSAYTDLSDGYQATLPTDHQAIVRVIIDGQLYSCTI